jgi:hypothetical protein
MKRAAALLLFACALAFAGSREREQNELQRYCDHLTARAGLTGWKIVVLISGPEAAGMPEGIGHSISKPRSRVAVLWIQPVAAYRAMYQSPEGRRLDLAGMGLTGNPKTDQRVTVRHEYGHIINDADEEQAAVLFSGLTRRW